MVFIKHNSLKSDIFFNPIFIQGFSGSRLFRVRVFQSPGFSGSRFFRVQVFQSPGFSGSRFSRVQVFQGPGPGSRSRVQGPNPGFRSSHFSHKFFYLLFSVTQYFLLGFSWSSDKIPASDKKNTSKKKFTSVSEQPYGICTKIPWSYPWSLNCLEHFSVLTI